MRVAGGQRDCHKERISITGGDEHGQQKGQKKSGLWSADQVFGSLVV